MIALLCVAAGVQPCGSKSDQPTSLYSVIPGRSRVGALPVSPALPAIASTGVVTGGLTKIILAIANPFHAGLCESLFDPDARFGY